MTTLLLLGQVPPDRWQILWELHPALNHFPIAFLLGGVGLDLYAWRQRQPSLAPVASGLIIAGFLLGVVSALSGLAAFFTVWAHTALAHDLMYWHLGVQVGAMILFGWVAFSRWYDWTTSPTAISRILGLAAVLMLCVGSFIGGLIVYRGGAGIAPELLAPEIRKSHVHVPDH